MDVATTETRFLLAAGFIGFATTLFAVQSRRAAAAGVPEGCAAD